MKDLSRYINKMPVKVELDTSMEKILAIQLLYKQVIDVMDTIEGGSVINVKSDWNAEEGSESEILNKPTNVSAFINDTGYLTEHQDISGKADKQDVQYEDIYLGVAATSEEAMIEANHHDVLLKGRSVSFSNANSYVWAILPEEYIPIVKMNGFEIPITLDVTVTVNETIYKVWKSNSSFSGTLNIYLL